MFIWLSPNHFTTSYNMFGWVDRRQGSGRPRTACTAEIVILLVTSCSVRKVTTNTTLSTLSFKEYTGMWSQLVALSMFCSGLHTPRKTTCLTFVAYFWFLFIINLYHAVAFCCE